MRRTLAAIILTLAPAAPAPAQTGTEAARVELHAGASAYREGRFEEGERHFRRAVEFDPAGKETRLFIARALRQRYRSGVMTPENLVAGERAAAAYQEVLKLDPGDDAAFKAVFTIYKQMKREGDLNEWLLRRANDDGLVGGKRAEAFALLAAEQWRCSNRITEQPSSRKAAEASGAAGAYAMPANEGDFIRARRCVTDGVAFARRALELDARSLNALAQKAKLLHEATKLAEMEGDLTREAEVVRQQQEAQEAFEARRDEVKAEDAARKAARRAAASDGDEPEDKSDDEEDGGDKDGEEDRAAPAKDAAPAKPDAAAPGPAAGDATRPVGVPAGVEPPGPSATPVKKPAVGGDDVLNLKALSKPQPAYPPGAKAAGAHGTVVVRVVVDEGGRVAEAEAISGHPLLREAALTAARDLRFTPTRLSGRPVKVAGVVSYYFAPDKD